MTTVNADVAARLDEAARVLEERGANRFRVSAYRRAAASLRALDRPVDEILRDEGTKGLQELPGVGESLSRAIGQILAGGRLPMLDRLRGEQDPVALLSSVPGIGRIGARRLYEDLGIATLEELEVAAWDGRLRQIAGYGEKRLAGIRDCLARRLGRVRRVADGGEAAPVAELLDVDAEYRAAVRSGRLSRIAPRRMNPRHEAWLPVLRTERGARRYTALFSNTPRAHRLGTTRDWVVLYESSGAGERQSTVVTERHGPLAGKRIVRGREAECAAHYERLETPAPPRGGSGASFSGSVRSGVRERLGPPLTPAPPPWRGRGDLQADLVSR